jgi:hypothetical protein
MGSRLQQLGLPSQIEPFDLEDVNLLTEETSPDVRRWAPTTGVVIPPSPLTRL